MLIKADFVLPGSSSGFSIFSPKGIQWVNEKTGDTSFQDMVLTASEHDIKWSYWKPEVFGDLFKRRIFQQLPPREEVLSLLRDFFQNFNCMFPLFHEPTFMHLVNRHYSNNPYEGGGWWASFNVALAIAHRLRVMSNAVPQEEDRKAWGFLKNAMGCLTELTMRNTDLLSVQALLGMVRSLDPFAALVPILNRRIGPVPPRYTKSATLILFTRSCYSTCKQYRTSQARLQL